MKEITQKLDVHKFYLRTASERSSLDKRDYLILYELEQDSTKSLNSIAKKVRLSKEAVFHRIKKLEECGIIKSYMYEIDVYRLGYQYYPVLIKLANTTPKTEQQIIDYLKKRNEVAWLVRCDGQWNINLTLLAKDNHQVSLFFDNFLKAYGRYIIDKRLFITDEIHYLKRSFSTWKMAGEFVSFPQQKVVSINEEEHKLLALLSDNARAPIVQIAKKLRTTPRIVSYTIKKLRSLGVIKGARIFVDFSKRGHKFYKVWFSLHGMNAVRWKEFLSYFQKTGVVLWVTKVTGCYDLSIEMEARELGEFRKVICEMEERFAGSIIRHESLLITSEEVMRHIPNAR
jgi:DNA-binding Lrp family transcriptional regulator